MPITVHIIDQSKASLVMSSEVFKDKIPGTIVTFSVTAKEGLAFVQDKMIPGRQGRPDALVVDFDLPDADGVSLIKELRKFYKGPIFMTAYPGKIVEYAVKEELFHYHDACCWVPKPVRFDVLEKHIEQFIVNRHRLGKRFDVNFPSLMVGKGEGRGKRAPKFEGKLVSISMGGVGINFPTPTKLNCEEEFVISMGVPKGKIEGAMEVSVLKALLTSAAPVENGFVGKQTRKQPVQAKAIPKKSKLTPAQKVKELARLKMEEKIRKQAAVAEQARLTAVAAEAKKARIAEIQNLQEYRVKATVAWVSNGGCSVGFQFSKIAESQLRQIETFLKGLPA